MTALNLNDYHIIILERLERYSQQNFALNTIRIIISNALSFGLGNDAS